MKETDWKKFVIIKKEALQVLCKRILEQSNDIISDDAKNFHERYLALYQHIQDGDRLIVAGFDGHSRSRAFIQLMTLRELDLVSDEALSVLSENLQEGTRPIER